MVGLEFPGLLLPPFFFFNAAFTPAAAPPGGILDLVAAIAIPLTPLIGIPELTPQTLGPIQKAAPKQFLRRGLDFFL